VVQQLTCCQSILPVPGLGNIINQLHLEKYHMSDREKGQVICKIVTRDGVVYVDSDNIQQATAKYMASTGADHMSSISLVEASIIS